MGCQRAVRHPSFLLESWFLKNNMVTMCVFWILQIFVLLDMFLSEDKQICIALKSYFFQNINFLFLHFLFILLLSNIKNVFQQCQSYANGESLVIHDDKHIKHDGC